MKKPIRMIIVMAALVGVLLPGASTLACGAGCECSKVHASGHTPVAKGYDALDVEDHSSYSSEYIFGLTKGVVRSTLAPALKPAALVVTVPLDVALLPFAVVGGFFR